MVLLNLMGRSTILGIFQKYPWFFFTVAARLYQMNRTKKKAKIGHLKKNPSSQKMEGTLTKKVKGHLMGQKKLPFFCFDNKAWQSEKFCL